MLSKNSIVITKKVTNRQLSYEYNVIKKINFGMALRKKEFCSGRNARPPSETKYDH